MNQEEIALEENHKRRRSKVFWTIFAAGILAMFAGNLVASGRFQRILDSENPAKTALPILAVSAVGGFLLLKSAKKFPNLNPIFVLFAIPAGLFLLVIKLIN